MCAHHQNTHGGPCLAQGKHNGGRIVTPGHGHVSRPWWLPQTQAQNHRVSCNWRWQRKRAQHQKPQKTKHTWGQRAQHCPNTTHPRGAGPGPGTRSRPKQQHHPGHKEQRPKYQLAPKWPRAQAQKTNCCLEKRQPTLRMTPHVSSNQCEGYNPSKKASLRPGDSQHPTP